MYREEVYSTIVAENDLSSILSKFDSEYIMDIITCALNSQSAITNTKKPNGIYSLDMKYTQEVLENEDNKILIQQLKEHRIMLYMEIIDYICNCFDINIDRSNITEQNVYYIAYHIYDIFINYYYNTVQFLVGYILKYRTELYDVLQLQDYKKNKDTSTIYNKKVYKNSKIAIIVSNLEKVIECIASYNISFAYFIKYIYSQQAVQDSILEVIPENADLFRKSISKIMGDPALRQNLISDVRVELSNATELSPDMDISNFVEQN